MKTTTRAMSAAAALILMTGCLDLDERDEVVDITPPVWDIEHGEPARAPYELGLDGLTHIEGHGAHFLSGETRLTMLHGAHALDVSIGAGEVSTLGIDAAEFGACGRMLTFELDDVRVLSGEESVRVRNLEASRFDIETLGTGEALVQIGGRLVASTEIEGVSDSASRGGRGGRGGSSGWNNDTQRARCEEVFGGGTDLGLVYRMALDVREATRIEYQYPQACALEGGDGMMIVEGGEAILSHTLHDATDDLTYTFNRSWDLEFDVLGGQDLDFEYRSTPFGPMTISAERGTGTLEFEELELGARARVDVVAAARITELELGFWYATRGYQQAQSGGSFWTWEGQERPELLISVEGMADDLDRGVCGGGPGLDITTSTPDVCQVVASEGAELYGRSQLGMAIDFSKKGTCALDVEMPAADQGRGLRRAYTFTLE